MYKIMTVWDMQEEFNTYGRENYFSDEGLEAINNCYINCCSCSGEIGAEVEFDVIAICSEWTEYGNGVVFGFDDFINDFSYLLDDEELEEEKVDAIFKKLENETYCVRLKNGNILQMIF